MNEQQNAQGTAESPPEQVHLADILPNIQPAIARKAARLSANGISEQSLRTVCKLTEQEWLVLQDTVEYQEAFNEYRAVSEVNTNGAERDITISTLENEALRETLRNVRSGICSPEFTLDALKYATKVRLEMRKQDQEKKAQFTAATQVVINLNDILAKALTTPRSEERIIEFDGDSRNVVNGMDTDKLLEAALGRPQSQEPVQGIGKQYNKQSSRPFDFEGVNTDDLEGLLVVRGVGDD